MSVNKKRNLVKLNLEANTEVVEDFVGYLKSAFERYLTLHSEDNDGEGIRYIDSFMTAHNFHKMVVLDLTERTENKALLKIAVDTFHASLADVS